MKHAAKRRVRLGIKRYLILGGAVVLAAATGLTISLASGATGATSLPWEPDPNAVGTLTFYDASGNVVTGGSLDQVMAAYAVGSATVVSGNNQAVLLYTLPQSSVSLTANWTSDQMTNYTKYPPTTGPSVVTSATTPVTTIASDDETPNQHLAGGFTSASDPNAAYQNVYQIRQLTALGSTISSKYNDADIMVDTTTNTWHEVYPVLGSAPTGTTTPPPTDTTSTTPPPTDTTSTTPPPTDTTSTTPPPTDTTSTTPPPTDTTSTTPPPTDTTSTTPPPTDTTSTTPPPTDTTSTTPPPTDTTSTTPPPTDTTSTTPPPTDTTSTTPPPTDTTSTTPPPTDTTSTTPPPTNTTSSSSAPVSSTSTTTAPVTTTSSSSAAAGSGSVGATDASGDPLASGFSATPGETIQLSVSSLTPNAVYDIVVHSTPVTVGSVTTDSSGSANYTLTVPSGLPSGAHTVQFVDANGTVGASLAFTITTLANAGSSSSLSNTGTDSKLGIELGLLLIVGGSLLVFAFRRRPRGKHIS